MGSCGRAATVAIGNGIAVSGAVSGNASGSPGLVAVAASVAAAAVRAIVPGIGTKGIGRGRGDRSRTGNVIAANSPAVAGVSHAAGVSRGSRAGTGMAII